MTDSQPPTDTTSGDGSDVEAELREQLTTTFERASYPVDDPFALIPLLPEGAETEFRAGSVVIPAVDLGLKYREYQSFPYESVEALVDDLIEAMKTEGDLPDDR